MKFRGRELMYQVRDGLLGLLNAFIPDYIVGRILYRYYLFKDRLAPILGGIWSFLPLRCRSPRSVEYKWVIDTLRRINCNKRLLDVGCSGSYLCYELLHLGFNVHGLDAEPYQCKKTSFMFHLCDIVKTPFPDNYFDVIVAVSVLEHIGLGAYGDPRHPDGDRLAIKELRRILSGGGYLLITVPYAYGYSVTWRRVYGWETLISVTDDFHLIEASFFVPTSRFYASKTDLFIGGGRWLRASKLKAEEDKAGISIACLLLRKKA